MLALAITTNYIISQLSQWHSITCHSIRKWTNTQREVSFQLKWKSRNRLETLKGVSYWGHLASRARDDIFPLESSINVTTLFSSLPSSLTVDLIRYQFERVVCNPRIGNIPPPFPRASPLRVMGGLAQVFTSNSRAGIWYTVWYAPVSNFITYSPTPLKPPMK